MCVCWMLWKQLLRVHGGIHWSTICVLKYDVLFEVLYKYQILEYNSGVTGTDYKEKKYFLYDYMYFISSRI